METADAAWDRQEELRREYAEDAHHARQKHRCWCSEDIPGWCPGVGRCPMVALKGEKA